MTLVCSTTVDIPGHPSHLTPCLLRVRRRTDFTSTVARFELSEDADLYGQLGQQAVEIAGCFAGAASIVTFEVALTGEDQHAG